MFTSKPGRWPFAPVLQMCALGMIFVLGATMAKTPGLRAVLAICGVGLAVAAGLRYLKVRRALRTPPPQ